MVEIYQTIEQNRHDLSQLDFDEDLEAAWPFTLGGTVMNRSLGQAIHQNTDYVVASQVQAYLNAFLRANGWEWDPRGDGPGGGAVLDFAQDSGSCWFPASALELLLYAPLPYGFQQGQDEIELYRYQGAANAGFFARHDHRRDFGLGYNVVNPESRQLTRGIYFWGSHFVVAFDDRFYDPNYNRLYRRPGDMAFAQMASFDESWSEDGRVLTRAVTTVDLSGDLERAPLDGVYVQITGDAYSGQLFDYASELNRNLGAGLYELPYVGPFGKPFDATAHYRLDLG